MVPKFLAEYTEPTVPDDVRAQLDDFLNRRVAEGGVATDY